MGTDLVVTRGHWMFISGSDFGASTLYRLQVMADGKTGGIYHLMVYKSDGNGLINERVQVPNFAKSGTYTFILGNAETTIQVA